MTITLETIIIIAIGIAVGIFIVYRVVKTVRGETSCGCGCGCSSSIHLPNPPVEKKAKRARFTVDNMHCGKCENTIRMAIGSMEGVLEVESDHKTGRVTIDYQGEATPEAVRAKLDEIAFTVRDVTLL